MRSLLPLLAALAPLATTAGPMPATDVPVPLKSWVPWVLHGAETAACPLARTGDASSRRCLWPGVLSLDVGDTAGRFTLAVEAWAEAFLPLPGGADRIPVDITIDGKPTVAVPARDGGDEIAGVWLSRGSHRITGEFHWRDLPESLPIPIEIGLVALKARGKAIPFPRRDADGRLWFHEGNAAEGNTTTLAVFRRLVDEVPFLVETRIVLDLSGKKRELRLRPAVLADFIPMEVSGDLPARLDPDGTLRVQGRAGHFVLRVLARHKGPVSAIDLPQAGEDWPAFEIWSFEPHRDLRVVTVEGGVALDPSQTELPEEWRQLPAYRIAPGTGLVFRGEQRGDPLDEPDRLGIYRTLWLDFDGGGITYRDRLSGTMARDGRLELAPPGALGQANDGKRDRLITRLDASGLPGIEVARGPLSLVAVSRLEGTERSLSIVGWDRGFESAEATLHLPPGWKLFSATGVDEVPGSWFGRWDLLTLFLALALAVAIWRLWGRPWGLIALCTFALTFPETDGPRWSWLVVVAIEPLCRLLPKGKLRFAAGAARLVAQVALVLFAIAFLSRDLRHAIYPALEMPTSSNKTTFALLPKAQEMESESAPAAGVGALGSRGSGFGGGGLGLGLSLDKRSSRDSRNAKQEVFDLDPKAIVQTGPGLPSWEWSRQTLSWNGPVGPREQMRLWLLSPALNRWLAAARLVLLGLLLARVLMANPWRFARRHAMAIVWLVALPGAVRAEAVDPVPPEGLLAELRNRLLAPAPCAPNCTSIDTMTLAVSLAGIRIDLDVGAVARASITLPGNATQWLPATVLVDGKPTPALARDPDGTLHLLVAPGRHQIRLEGPVPGRDSFELAVPQRPHRIVSHLQRYSLAGLHEDGGIDAVLVMTRSGRSDLAAAESEPAPLPPALTLTRSLRLGVTWSVETELSRRTPIGQGVTVEVALLAGESVTTPGIRVEGTRVVASLPPGESSLRWSSVLPQAAELGLLAPSSDTLAEVWELRHSADWHVTFDGLAPIRLDPNDGASLKWRPWPGESVTLRIEKPRGVEGQTLTIDETTLVIEPGTRATSYTLRADLRASQGIDRILRLPEDVQLESLKLDGVSQPVRQSGQEVSVPIAPGTTKLEIKARDERGIEMLYRVPAFDLGGPAVNNHVEVQLSRDRWILFSVGPRLGPVILFWSDVVVLIVAGFVLARYGRTRLKTHQWILLGLGLSQLPIIVSGIIAGWLLLLAHRRTTPALANDVLFNLRQILIAVWTLVALGLLLFAIQVGLLGHPDMQIEGNSSNLSALKWFSDRTDAILPTPWILSVPITVYRVAMLAWSSWLAFSIVRWLRDGYRDFVEGGVWNSKPKPGKPTTAATTVQPPKP